MAEGVNPSTPGVRSASYPYYSTLSNHKQHMNLTYLSTPLYQFAIGGCDYASINDVRRSTLEENKTHIVCAVILWGNI